MATSSSSAVEAKRLPRVVAWAATLWLRPAMTSSACSVASRPSRASVAMPRSRSTCSDASTCSCSTFSVRSRDVMPLWMCSAPASAQNSSMRALTSWRVTFSRAAIEARSTWSTTASYASMTPSGVSTPRSRWARSTAIHSRRSSTILCSGDQMRAISAEA